MADDARSSERNRDRTALRVRAGAVAAWLAVGVAALLGDVITTALRPTDAAARATVIAAMWLAYALVLAALLLPGSRALTVARIGVPAGALELAFAAASLSDPVAVVGHLFCVVGTLIVFHPAYAEAQVDAASYGDERRFLLRPPGPVIVALVLPMGAVTLAGVAAGPLLLADRGWPAGIVAAAIGLPVAALRGPHPVPAGPAFGWCSSPMGWCCMTISLWPSRCRSAAAASTRSARPVPTPAQST